MPIKFEKLKGNWYCKQENLQLSIMPELTSDTLNIIYYDDRLSKEGTDNARIKIHESVIDIKCRLGRFTLIYDDKDMLFFRAFESNGKSYVFDRIIS